MRKIWQIRRVFSTRSPPASKTERGHRCAARTAGGFVRFTARLQKKIELPIACFGHAGDGNIHVNIMLDANDSAAVKRGEAALDELFRQVCAWNGAITGEHGIGLAKKRWWPLAVSKKSKNCIAR
jgi:glycolate oxidase